MLRNTLKGIISEAALEALGIAPTARAETLPVSDYIRITNSLA
jgi:16S rRNA (adenine1518-N6/adenine1519-N6)-dimethyltransferase